MAGINPLFVMLLGVGTVFVGLICLIYLTKLMSFAIRKLQKEPIAKSSESAAETAPALPVIEDRKAFSALVAAAIASCMETEAEGIRILSIRPLSSFNGGSNPEKGQLVAAVSASIAAYMGKDVSGLRIHSITKI